MKKPKGHAPFPSNARHDCHTPTLKRPLSMMSIILYCWLMSFSSTRFLSAFSWSFLLVSNSRLSERRGQEDATRRTKGQPQTCLGTDGYSRVFTNGGRIQISRLESCLGLWGSGSEQRAVAASARSTVHTLLMVSRGQQRRSPERARPEEKRVPHHRKKEENKQNSLI